MSLIFKSKDALAMPKDRDDRRTVYSKKMIRESLYELLREKPLNKISVTEICDRADVNRSTFYSYYCDIYDLHDQITKEFFSLQKKVVKHIKEAIKTKDSLADFTYADFYKIVFYYLETVEENTELYKFIFNQNTDNSIHASFGKIVYLTIKDVLNPLIGDSRAEELKKAFTFVAGGTTALIMKWMETNCETPAEEMSEYVARYYYGTFKAHSMQLKKD